MGHQKLDLERIVFIGRSYEEYKDMFNLSDEELAGKKILDCPAGACSFTAIANSKGLNSTAADIAYDHSEDALYHKGLKDIQHAVEQMKTAKNNYVWKYFSDMEALHKHRLQALADSTADRKKSPNKYIPAALPSLPFSDNEFDVILSAHFLFMYDDRLDETFHFQTIKEFLRVARQEIRIFPLVDLKGKRSIYLDKVIEDLKNKGFTLEEVNVNYEFQENANTMLVIKKNEHAKSSIAY
ncbi:SAM-dependent methyltransferase [Niallia sp. NCCP-28]|nr:SAM-dependent methyltransferase [Niallia sp. NCCP-28]